MLPLEPAIVTGVELVALTFNVDDAPAKIVVGLAARVIAGAEDLSLP